MARRWIPEEGVKLNAQLPGELCRSEVVTVCSENVCIVKLGLCVAKSHTYQKDQVIPLKRSIDDMGQEVWKAISDMEMDLAVRADEEAAAEREEERKQEEAAKAAVTGARIPVYTKV